jgi:hypothetical protein
MQIHAAIGCIEFFFMYHQTCIAIGHVAKNIQGRCDVSTSTNIVHEDIDNLELDELNPRLPENVARTQKAMVDHIAKSTSIEDLMSAIVENGFFAGEPLIAIPKKDKSGKETGKYIIVEGNRRLSAVRLINDPYYIAKPTSRIISLSESNKTPIKKLPVVIRKDRDDILPYLGFRHITGVKAWEPLAKARYMKQLFDYTDKNLSANERYIEVARTIGSRKDHIKRNLDALAVYKLIDDNDFFNIPDLNEESLKFAVLSTALADEKIGAFVGVSQLTEQGPRSNEVILNPNKINYDAVKDLTNWLYLKDAKGRTIVGESRNIKDLAAVVSNKTALTQLRSGASLKLSYQLTTGMSEDFIELILSAENSLREAASIVATVEYDESSIASLLRISQTIKLLHSTLMSKNLGIDDGI